MVVDVEKGERKVMKWEHIIKTIVLLLMLSAVFVYSAEDWTRGIIEVNRTYYILVNDTNCSELGSCAPNVAYMNYNNVGDFNISENMNVVGNATFNKVEIGNMLDGVNSNVTLIMKMNISDENVGDVYSKWVLWGGLYLNTNITNDYWISGNSYNSYIEPGGFANKAVGLTGNAVYRGTDNIEWLRGIESRAYMEGIKGVNQGNVTNAASLFALQINKFFNASGNITNAYGLYVSNPVVGLNRYGVYVRGSDVKNVFQGNITTQKVLGCPNVGTNSEGTFWCEDTPTKINFGATDVLSLETYKAIDDNVALNSYVNFTDGNISVNWGVGVAKDLTQDFKFAFHIPELDRGYDVEIRNITFFYDLNSLVIDYYNFYVYDTETATTQSFSWNFTDITAGTMQEINKLPYTINSQKAHPVIYGKIGLKIPRTTTGYAHFRGFSVYYTEA